MMFLVYYSISLLLFKPFCGIYTFFLFSVQIYYNFILVSVQNRHSKYVMDVIMDFLGSPLLRFQLFVLFLYCSGVQP